MPHFDYDLLVIGGGPAGEKGGAQAAYFGHRVALVERKPQLGGACINTGTLASKTLRESALFLSGFKARQLYGIEATVKKDISLQQFMYRTSVVQERERERASANLLRHNIDRMDGVAEIIDPHKVLVRIGPREEIHKARFILVATGSSPHRPADIPFNRESVFDSDTVLEMKSLPESMLVVGGGVIGCEYACIFAALGIRVLLVEGKDRLLGFLDHEISDALTSRMRGMGIELVMQDGLESVKLDGTIVRTRLKSGRDVETESLLYAAGRNGNVAGLGLEKLGIVVSKRGQVEVDPITYQTKVPNIYAAGDVIGFPALASTSMEQGRLAVCHAFDLKYKTRLAPILPYGIYTIPEVSCVGESEESCREKKIDHVVGRSRFGQQARGQIIGDTEGMIKLVFAAPGGKLLGAHVIGEMASELVHVAMACLHFEGDVDFFIQSVFNYPTLGDAYKYAAYDALGQLNKVRAKG
jgi:NAD(P) transhydrogenase